jgi:hypothetical protein
LQFACGMTQCALVDGSSLALDEKAAGKVQRPLNADFNWLLVL